MLSVPCSVVVCLEAEDDDLVPGLQIRVVLTQPGQGLGGAGEFVLPGWPTVVR